MQPQARRRQYKPLFYSWANSRDEATLRKRAQPLACTSAAHLSTPCTPISTATGVNRCSSLVSLGKPAPPTPRQSQREKVPGRCCGVNNTTSGHPTRLSPALLRGNRGMSAVHSRKKSRRVRQSFPGGLDVWGPAGLCTHIDTQVQRPWSGKAPATRTRKQTLPFSGW